MFHTDDSQNDVWNDPFMNHLNDCLRFQEVIYFNFQVIKTSGPLLPLSPTCILQLKHMWKLKCISDWYQWSSVIDITDDHWSYHWSIGSPEQLQAARDAFPTRYHSLPRQEGRFSEHNGTGGEVEDECTYQSVAMCVCASNGNTAKGRKVRLDMHALPMSVSLLSLCDSFIQRPSWENTGLFGGAARL